MSLSRRSCIGCKRPQSAPQPAPSQPPAQPSPPAPSQPPTLPPRPATSPAQLTPPAQPPPLASTPPAQSPPPALSPPAQLIPQVQPPPPAPAPSTQPPPPAQPYPPAPIAPPQPPLPARPSPPASTLPMQPLPSTPAPPVQPPPLQPNLPNLGDIFAAPIPTVRHLPRSTRTHAARVFEQEIRALAQNAGNIYLWKRVLMFSGCILVRPDRHGSLSLSQVFRTRLSRWEQGEVCDLWDEASAIARRLFSRSRAQAGSTDNARRALRLAREGAFSRAVQALSADTVAPNSACTQASLRALHPHGPPLAPQANLPQATQFSSDLVLKAITSFNRGTACGTSGMYFEHIKSYALARPSFLDQFTVLVNLLSSAQCPRELAPHLAGATLIALVKPQGGVRPIAVGEVLRRIVGKCFMAHMAEPIRNTFMPLQLGVGVPGGLDAIIHHVRQLAHTHGQDTSIALLQLDFTNAFNLISREEFLTKVMSMFPGMARWAHLMYDQYSFLVSRSGIVESQQGVQQGDPLGPLLFSVALHGFLTELSQRFPQLLGNLWYLDDGHLIGDTRALRDVVHFTLNRGPSFGLHLNLSKCRLWWPTTDATINQVHPDIPISNGVKVLGCPFGDASFFDEFFTKRFERLEESIQRLSSLDDVQVELSLLRQCLSSCRYVHLARALPRNEWETFMLDVDDLISTSLSQVIREPLTLIMRRQASLPIRLGGLGLMRLERICDGAFLSSVSYAHALISGAQLSPAPRILDVHEQAFDAYNAVTGGTEQVQDFFATPTASHLLTRKIMQKDFDEFLASTSLSQEDRARLRSCTLPHSGDWLQATPSMALGLAIPSPEMRLLVLARLGGRLFPHGSNCPHVRCVSSMDDQGLHALSCAPAGRSSRHNGIRDRLFSFMRESRLHPRVEYADNTSNRRPGDVFLPLWHTGRPACLDISVVSPCVPSRVQRAAAHTAAASEDAIRDKLQQYSLICQRNGHDFFPLVFECFGGVCPRVHVTLKALARMWHDNSGHFVGLPYEYFFQALGVLLQRFNGQMLLSATASHNLSR